MLKNKKAVYILIPLNLFIWGFFIYRFYTSYNSYDEPVESERMPGFKTEELKDSVTYTLSLAYKDPFLKDAGNNYRSASAMPGTEAKQSAKKQEVKASAPVIPKQLPELKYLGLIKNSSSGMTTALVSVNGQSKLVKANDVVDGIVFKSFNKDSLVAKWGKERIVARK